MIIGCIVDVRIDDCYSRVTILQILEKENLEIIKISKSGLKVRFIKFEPQNLTEIYWVKIFNHTNLIRQETNPGEPPFKKETLKKWYLLHDPFKAEFHWLIFPKDTDELIGMGDSMIYTHKALKYEKNKQIAWIRVSINKNYRRRGVCELFSQPRWNNMYKLVHDYKALNER